MRWIKIVQNHDMRERHQLRLSPLARKLRPGQCIVALNRSLTIGRIIDSTGAIHDYYEREGHKIDLATLKAMVLEGFAVQMSGKEVRLVKQAS